MLVSWGLPPFLPSPKTSAIHPTLRSWEVSLQVSPGEHPDLGAAHPPRRAMPQRSCSPRPLLPRSVDLLGPGELTTP